MHTLKYILIVSLFLPLSVFAVSPTIIGAPVHSDTTGTSLTLSVTVPSTGQNRALMCLTWAGALPTGVTWNGGAMTLLLNNAPKSFAYLHVWYLANPTTGAHNAVVSLASGSIAMSCFTLQDTAQSSPIDGSVDSSTTSSLTSLSSTFSTGVNNSMVFLFTGVSVTGSSLTQGAGQTEVENFGVTSNSNYWFNLGDIVQATAGSISPSLSWTNNSAGVEQLGFGIKYLAPTAASTGVPLIDDNWFMLF